MTDTLIIMGKYPNLNDYTLVCRNPKMGASLGNKMKKQAMDNMMFFMAKINHQYTKPVWISYEFYEPNRRRDQDNVASFFIKCFQDALVQRRILKDDGWNEIRGWDVKFHVDKNRPRIEVTIVDD